MRDEDGETKAARVGERDESEGLSAYRSPTGQTCFDFYNSKDWSFLYFDPFRSGNVAFRGRFFGWGAAVTRFKFELVHTPDLMGLFNPSAEILE